MKINKLMVKGSLLNFLLIMLTFFLKLPYSALYILILIGVYVGWQRDNEGMGTALVNGFYTSLISGFSIGIVASFIEGTFAVMAMLFVMFLIFLIPGSIIGWLISSIIKPGENKLQT